MSALVVQNNSVCNNEVSVFEESEMLLLLSIIHEIRLYGAQPTLINIITRHASGDAVMKPCPYNVTVLEGISLMMKIENILHALK
jgi:hypothetical protein